MKRQFSQGLLSFFAWRTGGDCLLLHQIIKYVDYEGVTFGNSNDVFGVDAIPYRVALYQ